MSIPRPQMLAGVVTLAAVIVLIASLKGQEPSPSPSPTPTPTPKAVIKITPSPTPDVGAQNFHRWGSITIFNGLPSDAVHAIAQTADGIMWFGTDNGLGRFDGRRIERIELGNEPANHVQAIVATTDNGVWLG